MLSPSPRVCNTRTRGCSAARSRSSRPPGPHGSRCAASRHASYGPAVTLRSPLELAGALQNCAGVAGTGRAPQGHSHPQTGPWRQAGWPRRDGLPSCSGPAGTEAGQRPREGEGAVPTAEPLVSCQAALGPREAARLRGQGPCAEGRLRGKGSGSHTRPRCTARGDFLTRPGRCPDAVRAGTGAATLPRTGTAHFSEDRCCRLEKVPVA